MFSYQVTPEVVVIIIIIAFVIWCLWLFVSEYPGNPFTKSYYARLQHAEKQFYIAMISSIVVLILLIIGRYAYDYSNGYTYPMTNDEIISFEISNISTRNDETCVYSHAYSNEFGHEKGFEKCFKTNLSDDIHIGDTCYIHNTYNYPVRFFYYKEDILPTCSK